MATSSSELNNFAIRSFRDVADQDYIAARTLYRANLVPQFLWASLQSVEKYLKCILLLNRISAKKINHNLEKAVNLIQKEAPFELRMSDETKSFIEYLDTYGRFRYLETSYHSTGEEIYYLDRMVWEVRRYCAKLNYETKKTDGSTLNMMELELRRIEKSEAEPPNKFRLFSGYLERVIDGKKSYKRENLIWMNFFYGSRSRKNIEIPTYFQATNAPLSLNPEMLEDVLEYVFLPKDVITAFRARIESDRLKKRN